MTSPMNWQAFLYRHISHMKDYTGGPNQWLSCDLFADGEYEKLLDTLLALRKKTKEAVPYAA